MLSIFDPLREINMLSVAVRLVIAMVCGGIIGIEREYKRRPAGFRTHILICLGAAMTTLTSQYMCLVTGYFTDMARLGAQVIAGIGFIGAGTIIVTRRQRVKGLTTAAGLWTSAIVGLACGAGFFEGGLLVTGFILMAEMLFSKWEYILLNTAPEVNLYIEYTGRHTLEKLLKLIHECDLKLLDLEITRHGGQDSNTTCAIFSLRLNKKYSSEAVIDELHMIQNIVLIEEL